MADFRVVLYPEVMFRPGGLVWDWGERVTDYFVYWARREAPKRTGRLAASIWGDVDSVGRLELAMTLGAEAANPHTGYDYAPAVLFGTDGATVEPPGVMMHNEGGPYGDYFFRYNKGSDRNWYRGQDSNDFFSRARHHVQGRYRSIGSWSFEG